MDRTHQRAVWRDAHSRERERRVERRPHERAIVGSPFGRCLIEHIEQRPHPLEPGRFGQLLIRREQLMRQRRGARARRRRTPGVRIPRRRAGGRTLQGAKARRRRAPARGAPRGVPPGHDDSTRVDSEAAAESRERAGVSPQDFQRLSVRSEGCRASRRRAPRARDRAARCCARRGSPGSAGCRAPVAAGSCRATPTDRAAAERCRGTPAFGERNSAWRRALIAVSPASCPSGASNAMRTTSRTMWLRSGSAMPSVSARRATGTPSAADVRTAGCLAPTAP